MKDDKVKYKREINTGLEGQTGLLVMMHWLIDMDKRPTVLLSMQTMSVRTEQ